MLLALLFIAGALCLPTPKSEENDGPISRKILGSSVVTSVSVIMDVGNGSKTYYSDAVGRPVSKPSAATQLASPINLLNPDRYEFYTFDDSGDLVKRLMTLDEIQGIIASGDGEASNYNSQSLVGDEPEKRVDDVVTNVQNVLKEEMEAHKTSDNKPTLDTPDVTATWSMILPAIFGNSGDNILPQKQQNAATAETIMIEPTTRLPTEEPTTETLAKEEPIRTEADQNGPLDIPVVDVQFNDLADQDAAESKTDVVTTATEESPTTEQNKPIVISTPAPFSKTGASSITPLISTPAAFTKTDSTLPPLTTKLETTATEVLSTKLESSTTLETSSVTEQSLTTKEESFTTELPTTTNLPVTFNTSAESTTIKDQLTTFFIVVDYKPKPNATSYSTPRPFTTVREETTPYSSFATESQQTILSEETRPPTTQSVAQESVDVNNVTNQNKETTMIYTLPDSSTDKITYTTTVEPNPQTLQDLLNDKQLSTLKDILEQTTTEALSEEDSKQTTQLDDLTKVPESTTESRNVTDDDIAEFLEKLFQTTAYQINANLSETTTSKNEIASEKEPSSNKESVPVIESSPNKSSEKESSTRPAQEKESSTRPTALQTETTATADQTTDPDIRSSIEQLISQAIGTPELTVDNEKESEKVAELVKNSNAKPMVTVQEEAATAASILLDQSDDLSEADKTNQAIDSLISQIVNQQGYPTTETSTTAKEQTTAREQTTNVVLNNRNSFDETTNVYEQTTKGVDEQTTSDITIDDRNRYEEIDLDSVTVSGKTEAPKLRTTTPKYVESTTSNEITSTELNLEETKYPTRSQDATETIPSTTEANLSTETNYEDYTSTELNDETSKNNEILTEEASGLPGLVKKANASDNFVIVASSSEYPDYASTENVNVVTSTLSGEEKSTTIKDEDKLTTWTKIEDSTSRNDEKSTRRSDDVTQKEDVSTELYDDVSSQSTQEDYTTETLTTTEQYAIDKNTVQPNPLSAALSLNDSTALQQILVTSGRPSVISTPQPFKETPQPQASKESVAISTPQPFKESEKSRPIQQLTFVPLTTINPSTPSTLQLLPKFTEKLPSILPEHSTTLSPISSTAAASSPYTPTFVSLPTMTAAPKIDKPAELKLIQNVSSSTPKAEMTWTLVSTVAPRKPPQQIKTSPPYPHKPALPSSPHRHEPSSSVDLVPKPLQGFSLEDSTSNLDTDVFQFTELCNELAFSFWGSVTSGISFARSVVVSPFATTSVLAMVFLGARGSTSGEMNDILKLDDMVTFNPHAVFKNVIESIEVSKKAGVAASVFVKELYSDKNKGKLLNFYKERVKQFYDGHVEEVNFKEISDVIRRRTNLLVKRQTWGKIPEYLKDNNLYARPPLAAVSASIFQTDCSEASAENHDGELHFVVLPSIRQRKLVPIPAVVYRSGFLAGYDPNLDATAVAIGTKDQTISTIFVIPGQQGFSAPGDGLMKLEARLIDSAFRQGAWSRLLRSLIARPGLEVQIPRFAHKSVINATMALQRMGLRDLFNSRTADLKGLNGVAHELYLSDIIQVNTFATCGGGRTDETHHSEVYPATTNRSFRRIRKIHHYNADKHTNSDILEEPRDYQRAFHDPLYDPSYLSLPLQLRPRQARVPEVPRLRFDRPFLYFVRHNPTGLILHMGRFNPRLLP